MPSYQDLFGRADICECQDCRSVYSAAAYFVDIMRFLENSGRNEDTSRDPKGRSPLDILSDRRPDLEYLALDCENTNTLIPYIDLANEVMEYYVANGNLSKDAVHDTGDTSVEELRANPQYTLIDAYKKLKDAVYPFSLPYHQPLDVIRKYLEHLQTSRYEIMQAFRNDGAADEATKKANDNAVAAEYLSLSEEEFKTLTSKGFDGKPDTKKTVDTSIVNKEYWDYYGYGTVEEFRMADLTNVPNFLKRTGLQYTELVEIVKTRFINPHQSVLTYLEEFISDSWLSGDIMYYEMNKILFPPSFSPPEDLSQEIELFRILSIKNISFEEFKQWVKDHFEEFGKIVTLYEPQSKCNLTNTWLRSLKTIYENTDVKVIPANDITVYTFSSLHRFIRLWRKTGWDIHELDNFITAFGETDITPELIQKLAVAKQLNETLKLPLPQLTCLWGNIDTYGDKPLYAKLFLSKSLLKIDPVFKPDNFGNYLTDPAAFLKDHTAVILAAFRITASDLSTIRKDAAINDDVTLLNIENISIIYRYVLLSKSLGLTISNLCTIKNLFAAIPFGISKDEKVLGTLGFVELVKNIKASGFSVPVLDYILTKTTDDINAAQFLQEETVLRAVKSVREVFLKIDQDHQESAILTANEELLRTKLSLLYAPDLGEQLIAIINGRAVFTTITKPNLEIIIPESLSKRLIYKKGSGLLQLTGVLSVEKGALLNMPGATEDFKQAVERIYLQPEKFLRDNFLPLFGIGIEDAIEKLLDRSITGDNLSIEKKWSYLYATYLPYLKKKLRRNTVLQNIAAVIGLDETLVSVLVNDHVDAIVQSLSSMGLTVKYFSDASSGTGVLAPDHTIDGTIDFDWADTAPLLDGFGVRWKGWLCPPANGNYTLIVEVSEADETFKLLIDNEVVLRKNAASAVPDLLSWEYDVPLVSGKLYKIVLEYADIKNKAGIHFSWKTDTTPEITIPAESLFPASVIQHFESECEQYHRAALFITGFKLGIPEVAHFIKYKANFENINFRILAAAHWTRINQYVLLRDSLPQLSVTLISVFEQANKTNKAAPLDKLVETLAAATGWNKDYIPDLQTRFIHSVEDLTNEKVLSELQNAIRITNITGMSPAMLDDWADIDDSTKKFTTDFDTLNNIADSIIKSVKAKYEETDWLDVSKSLSNKIRENQKQALISYLLVQKALMDWGAVDADSLFEYFLIDVQMDACMDTSRLVQAISSVQLFVTRCLLNLESNIDPATKKEKGASPGYIDTNRWEWMKNYRVWEANRKVFLYPENWLEPEWRDDKSPFFKEFESELLQNDMSNETAESALINYLYKLSEIADLEVCGMFQDIHKNEVHIIAKTNSFPQKYYYRKLDKYKKWCAWQKLSFDIPVIRDDNTNNVDEGIHVIPVVWKNRLFIFWPEFDKVQEGEYYFLNIKLAWSEYKNGKWMSKKISTNKFTPGYHDPSGLQKNYDIYPGDYRFQTNLENSDCLIVEILFMNDLRNGIFKFFENGLISTVYPEGPEYLGGAYLHFNSYMSDQTIGALPFSINTSDHYLFEKKNHKILISNHMQSQQFFRNLNSSFFYQDIDNSYTFYVEPIDKSKNVIKSPELSEYYGLRYGNVSVSEKSLHFNSFFHPYVNRHQKAIFSLAYGSPPVIYNSPDHLGFISDFNKSGIKELLKASVTYPNDDGNLFYNLYNPNLTKVEVLDHRLPAFEVNFSFNEFESNSLYNWELFFHVPLLIATRLSKNGRYQDAMKWFHYIFNPTINAPSLSSTPNAAYWQILPFKKPPNETLEEYFYALNRSREIKDDNDSSVIQEWLDKPFKPFLVARTRILAFMKNVILKYVENFIAWGDDLFRHDTIESISEATQLFIIANHILGPRPQPIPKRGTIKAENYHNIKLNLDDFSNVLVELENLFPFSSNDPASYSSFSGGLLGIGPALYFCIPNNENILKYWDTVDDRLFKIRHCMNIEGIQRTLALFSPPIDPGMLVKAIAQGLSITDILNDLSSPVPFYRFQYLAQRASEFCVEVKSLGNLLLSVIEKRDTEEFADMKAGHENTMLNLIMEIKKIQLNESNETLDSLKQNRKTSVYRLQHYLKLLGENESKVPSDNTEWTELPNSIEKPIEETSFKIIHFEKEQMDEAKEAYDLQDTAGSWEMWASVAHAFPNFTMSEGLHSFTLGGTNVGNALQAFAKHIQNGAATHTFGSVKASQNNTFLKQNQDRIFQANLSGYEIKQIDKQIIAAEIRIQLSQKEIANQQSLIDNANEIEWFLKDKFTNQELYQWMKEQLYGIYKQAWTLAYDMAKKAEKAYQFEIGRTDTNFIQYGYWEDMYQGLCAGEKLHLAIKQMEKSFIEENRRELELIKHISISRLNPYALLELKETGSCEIDLPEELFDLDYPGHYFRRIKSVSLTIPCIAGPYTTVNCTLRLLKNSIRINTFAGTQYTHNNDEGVPTDDDRFVENNIPFKSIATSSAQNDSGMFELNFRDERYLPFEGAGAISKWKLELNGKYQIDSRKYDFSQFDYETISDVILHVKYTAREDAGKFKKDALDHLTLFMNTFVDSGPFARLFSLKYDFPQNFYQFLQSSGTQTTTIEITKEHFSYLFAFGAIAVNQTEVFINPKKEVKEITVPTSFSISINAIPATIGAWGSISDTNVKKSTIGLTDFDPKTKWQIEASGLKKEEVDDLMILIYFHVKEA